MAWFKKKEEEEEGELPELPEMPDLPEIPKRESATMPHLERSALPDLSPSIKEIGQEDIKETLSQPPMQKSRFVIPEKTTLELSEESPLRPISRHPTSITMPRPATKKAEPIYVRLDKFETALQAFEDIKTKITDIEESLTKTREIKEKEEQELAQWERELEILKAKIEAIDKNMFNKID